MCKENKEMILTSKILNKLLNGEYIKDIYPMVDHIDTRVVWDGDSEYPMYDIDLKIYVNDPEMTTFSMYERGMDPHYLIDYHMMFLLKFMEISFRNIIQIYVKVIGPDGSVIYGI